MPALSILHYLPGSNAREKARSEPTHKTAHSHYLCSLGIYLALLCFKLAISLNALPVQKLHDHNSVDGVQEKKRNIKHFTTREIKTDYEGLNLMWAPA
jgi:hypothetical protein